MARSIIDCTGRTISIGDKVKTPSGRVIRVRGAAIAEAFHNAEKCELVDPDTPHSVSGGQGDTDTDCVIWGN